MLTTAYVKITVALNASVEDLPQDVMVFGVAARLEATELLPLRAVSKVMNKLATADDIWFNKLTVLTLQYPALSNMDQGAGESVFAWYARCACAICSGKELAQRHVRGESPYLQLYGKVEGCSFTPYGEMRFPIEYGAIVELIALKAREGCTDAS